MKGWAIEESREKNQEEALILPAGQEEKQEAGNGRNIKLFKEKVIRLVNIEMLV